VPVLTDNSTTDFKHEEWVAKFIGNKIYPAHTQTTISALECFQKNVEAFCTWANDQYTCDLSGLEKYDVKPGHRSYGGIMVLDSDKRVVSVSGEKPGSPNYDLELNRFLAAFAVHVIVERHATLVHLAISQATTIEITDSKYAGNYAANPAIRKLVSGLTTRVNQVSQNEVLLIGNHNSLVSRASSFTNESLVEFCSDKYKEYQAMSTTDLLAQLLPSHGPVKDAGYKVYKAANELVENICGKSMEPDIIEKMGLMLWNATFYHYLVGDYQIMNLINGHLPLTCTGKPHVQNQKYASLAATIAATTMTRALNVEDIIGLVTVAEGKQHWLEFEKSLNSIGEILPRFSLQTTYPAVNF